VDLAIYDPDLCWEERDDTLGRLRAELPPLLLAVLQSKLPDLALWHLIILAKKCPEVELMAASRNVFNINQL
jgi:hypothetical protein